MHGLLNILGRRLPHFLLVLPCIINGTGHTGPSEFFATSIQAVLRRCQNAILRRSPFPPV